MLEDWLHGAQGCIGESAADTLRFDVGTVEMLLIEECLELEVKRLDLSL